MYAYRLSICPIPDVYKPKPKTPTPTPTPSPEPPAVPLKVPTPTPPPPPEPTPPPPGLLYFQDISPVLAFIWVPRLVPSCFLKAEVLNLFVIAGWVWCWLRIGEKYTGWQVVPSEKDPPETSHCKGNSEAYRWRGVNPGKDDRGRWEVLSPIFYRDPVFACPSILLNARIFPSSFSYFWSHYILG